MKTPNLYIYPEDKTSLWTTDYIFYRREKKTQMEEVGSAHFCGPEQMGIVRIEFDIIPRYKDRGYATEALKELTEWAFMQKNVYEIEAYVGDENDAAIAVLTKSHYVYRKRENHVETYSIVKPKTTWLGLYFCIGIVMGLSLGIVLNSMVVGTVIGFGACIVMGVSMDGKAYKDRKSHYGKEMKNRSGESS